MRYVLGFDGGGTKTDCVLMDETGALLVRVLGGPTNPSRIGISAALAALSGTADQALEAAGKSAPEIADVCGAFAGAGFSRALPEFHRLLKQKFPNAKSAFVGTDLSMALAAAGEVPCVVVIAGTGSAVIGSDASGNLASEGGLGPVLGDPGSAYDIGRQAVILALHHYRAAQSSRLGNEILNVLHCDWIALQSQLRSNAETILPRIFPIVAQAANDGDDSARALMRSAAQDLSVLCGRVVNALKLAAQPFFLAQTGGVFARSPFFDDSFASLIRQIAPQVRMGPLPMTIAEFAARSAIDCLDRSPSQPWRIRF